MRVIKLIWYLLLYLPFMLVYELFNSFSIPTKIFRLNLGVLYAGFALFIHVTEKPPEPYQEYRCSLYENALDYDWSFNTKRKEKGKCLSGRTVREPDDEFKKRISKEDYNKIYYGDYSASPLSPISKFLAQPGNAYPVIAGFLFLSFFGAKIKRTLFFGYSPTDAFVAKYRALYPLVNKVKVMQKRAKKDENLKNITSRLPPHLQELISKK